mmetsp:Transcript_758/g.1027  ORF Transcript_758/g.1027 Transcript_758/m.1027 type:complete len:123 (+) Transcript_758:1098-1466(+)
MSLWSTGLFSCCDDFKVCVVSTFCCPCQLAYQRAAIDNEQCQFSSCFPFLFCPICCAVNVRADLREKYSVPGSFIADLFAMCVCWACAVAQQTRQLDMKGLRPAGMFMDENNHYEYLDYSEP